MVSILLKFVKSQAGMRRSASGVILKAGIFIILPLSFIFLPGRAEAAISNPAPLFRALSFSEKIPILMYHYIETAPASSTLKGLYLNPNIFEGQLKEIEKEKYNSVFVSEVARSLSSKKNLPANSLALTFDDGYEDFYTTAWPLLKKYKIKATVYIIINALDKPGYLTRAQLEEISASEFVEIGSHTFNHPDLKTLNGKKADYEITKSRKALEALTNKPVLSFCYPYGRYNNYDLRLASRAGYLTALTTAAGTSHRPSELMFLTRLRPGERNGKEFSAWLKTRF